MLKVKLCVQTQVEKEDIGNYEKSFLSAVFILFLKSSEDLQKDFVDLRLRFRRLQVKYYSRINVINKLNFLLSTT